MDINSEFYQSNNAIDEKQKSKNSLGKIFFVIFSIIALFFFFAFWGSGWSFRTILGIIFWVFFLKWLWTQSQVTSFNVGKMLVFGSILIVVSFFIPTPRDDDSFKTTNTTIKESEVKKVTSTDKKVTSTDKVASLDTSYLEDGVENDIVVKLLFDIERYMGITFSKIQNDDNVIWSSQNVQLQLEKSKSFYGEGLAPKDLDKLKSYFINNGATTGGLGFTFVPPVGIQSSGFALTHKPYQGMMCVIEVGDNGVFISCGFGPGGNPDENY